jgi:hypothetical protein
MLLRRWQMPMSDAIERLVGLQAQTTHSWYHGLWTRLEDFRPERLAEMLIKRQVVRIALMRSTIHLVTVRDCLWLRPLTQSVALTEEGARLLAFAAADADAHDIQFTSRG